MKEWDMKNLQEGLAILGATMLPWAGMRLEESYTTSMDVSQISAAPL